MAEKKTSGGSRPYRERLSCIANKQSAFSFKSNRRTELSEHCMKQAKTLLERPSPVLRAVRELMERSQALKRKHGKNFAIDSFTIEFNSLLLDYLARERMVRFSEKRFAKDETTELTARLSRSKAILATIMRTKLEKARISDRKGFEVDSTLRVLDLAQELSKGESAKENLLAFRRKIELGEDVEFSEAYSAFDSAELLFRSEFKDLIGEEAFLIFMFAQQIAVRDLKLRLLGLI